MGWDLVPRIASLLGKLVLAAVLVWLLVRWRSRLPGHVRGAWLVFALFYIPLAVQTLVLEGLELGKLLEPEAAGALGRLRAVVYDRSYLSFAALNAVVPPATLFVVAESVGLRAVAVALGALVVAAAVGATVRGMVEAWGSLLLATRLLGFLAVGGYLTVWAGFAVGWLAGLDRYFLAFFGVRTLFTLLLPVQEALFAVLGRSHEDAIWSAHLSLQALLYWIQAAIVVRLGCALARGAVPEPVVFAGDARFGLGGR